MAYEKAFQNSYHDLDENTKYRFAELELQQSLKHLTRFNHYTDSPRTSAIAQLYKAITPYHQQSDEHESRFFQALSSTYFNNPPKTEVIKYLIIYAQSYNKIRSITSASPNTIAKERYGIPYFHPAFDMWNPEMLQSWNNLKNIFNVWGEKQVHEI